jgi:predicted acyltransferase (DUF342 family)
MKFLIPFVFLPFVFVACHDKCSVGDTRCAKNVVEECYSDKDWVFVEDCSDVGPGEWVCCDPAFVYDDEEVTGCVPAGECDGGI